MRPEEANPMQPRRYLELGGPQNISKTKLAAYLQTSLDAGIFTIQQNSGHIQAAGRGEPWVSHAISIGPRPGVPPLPCTVTCRLRHRPEQSATAREAGKEPARAFNIGEQVIFPPSPNLLQGFRRPEGAAGKVELPRSCQTQSRDAVMLRDSSPVLVELQER